MTTVCTTVNEARKSGIEVEPHCLISNEISVCHPLSCDVLVVSVVYWCLTVVFYVTHKLIVYNVKKITSL